MAATNQHVTMWAGESKRLEVTIKDEAGTVIDITGLRVQWALRPHPRQGTAILHYDNQNLGNVSVVNAAGGVCRVTIPASATRTLEGVHYHEMKLTDADGLEHTVLTGKLTINAAILSAG